jgi:hypothetical protein
MPFASWAELVSPADTACVPGSFKVFVERPGAFELTTSRRPPPPTRLPRSRNPR